VCALFGVPADLVTGYIKRFFGAKKPDIAEKNALAAGRGFSLGEALVKRGTVSIAITKDPSVKDELFLAGSDAISLGALSAGCDFVSSYPMSPSTNVLTFLAQHKNEFGIIVEQAEDEIAAVNMALGAWYAGGRALVTTSGGGFALMTEGISLSGMLETPVVVHVGQRPGPATGLPTRTEQADLDLVLHAGHGEFPRAVFARLLEARPTLVLAVTKQIGGRLRRIENRVEHLAFRSVRSRLAQILLELAEDFGQRESVAGVRIDVPLTQGELATLVGSVRQTVNMALREFEQEGWIGRAGRHLVLLKRDELQRVADSGQA